MTHSDRRRCRILAVGAFAAATLSSPACFLFQRAAAKSDVRLGVEAEKTTSLDLRVERSSGQLAVAWTRECAIIRNATQATMTIIDGDHQENVALDLATLRQGSILYSPVTADVSFRLDVTDATRGTHEAAKARFRDSGLPRPAGSSPPDKQPAHVVD